MAKRTKCSPLDENDRSKLFQLASEDGLTAILEATEIGESTFARAIAGSPIGTATASVLLQHIDEAFDPEDEDDPPDADGSDEDDASSDDDCDCD